MTLNYAETISATRVQAKQLVWPVHPSGQSNDILNPDTSRFLAQVLDKAYGPLVARRKRAWVVVNPNAGQGGCGQDLGEARQADLRSR